MKVFFLFILIVAFSGGARGSATPSVVSQSVGRVEDRVVTSREVQISAVLERLLFPGKAAKNSNGLYELRLGQPEMMNEVTALLLEVVVGREAESFEVAKISEEQVQEAVRKVEKAVEDEVYWQSLEVSPGELKRSVSQKLTAKAFVQFKTHSMTGIISDAEALAYYEKNRLRFGDVPFVNFKDNIKTFLAQQQLEERTRAWFEIIKRKYKVRNILMENINNKVVAP